MRLGGTQAGQLDPGWAVGGGRLPQVARPPLEGLPGPYPKGNREGTLPSGFLGPKFSLLPSRANCWFLPSLIMTILAPRAAQNAGTQGFFQFSSLGTAQQLDYLSSNAVSILSELGKTSWSLWFPVCKVGIIIKSITSGFL